MNSWLPYALGSAFFAGLTALFGKMGVEKVNSDLATFFRTIIILIVIAFFITFKKEWNETQNFTRPTIIFLILSAIATGFSWLCYYKALQVGKVGRVAPVDKLSLVFAIVLALLFLGEKLTWQAALGSALIVAGTVILGIFS